MKQQCFVNVGFDSFKDIQNISISVISYKCKISTWKLGNFNMLVMLLGWVRVKAGSELFMPLDCINYVQILHHLGSVALNSRVCGLSIVLFSYHINKCLENVIRSDSSFVSFALLISINRINFYAYPSSFNVRDIFIGSVIILK